MSELEIIITVFVSYLFLLFGVAIWSSKETTNLEGYFIAGKKLPFWVVAFSTNATGESGWLLLGLTGMAYSVGLHALWVITGVDYWYLVMLVSGGKKTENPVR